MKSIKPGRGPSMMSGVVGLFMIGFGILWTILAAQASMVFALFGVLWTGIAVVTTVYHFKNATQKNRHSQFDITENGEEPDPLDRWADDRSDPEKILTSTNSKFCPYCGTAVETDFEFCNRCGKRLP